MIGWRAWRGEHARARCRLPSQREALAVPLPAAATVFEALPVLALDFETTGLDPARDQILSAGWVPIDRGRLRMGAAREIRVRPRGTEGVGQSATIHGLFDSDLAQASDEAALLDALLPALAGRVIAAHAASIERGFLRALLLRHGGVPLPNRFIDTLALARTLLEGGGVRIDEHGGALTLAASRARHGLAPHAQHSAVADALACGELLLAQVEALGGVARVRLRDLD
ncbi:exonuclease domain-containing protein [Luteimonas kalidii]|uniref:Exonuclease domain-containing protein n=1 Tax=Luteimonas kalidii TaxID=3042025 RepID=A0ABT6JPN8_9GAMM|nr:exonuclease domain-containing protein [Luteimonas kalidii]MDH5832658.1 exonuclease domain-containing protein [Luteimonas kalidii]